MYTQERYAMLDIETNLAWDTIWFAVVMYPSGDSIVCNTVEETHRALSGIDCVIGHNLIAFDLPRMKEVWSFEWNRNVIDTLFAAKRLFYTCIVLLSEQCHIMQNARQWRNIFTNAVMMKVC